MWHWLDATGLPAFTPIPHWFDAAALPAEGSFRRAVYPAEFGRCQRRPATVLPPPQGANRAARAVGKAMQHGPMVSARPALSLEGPLWDYCCQDQAFVLRCRPVELYSVAGPTCLPVCKWLRPAVQVAPSCCASGSVLLRK